MRHKRRRRLRTQKKCRTTHPDGTRVSLFVAQRSAQTAMFFPGLSRVGLGSGVALDVVPYLIRGHRPVGAPWAEDDA